jgi:hypothetical protein
MLWVNFEVFSSFFLKIFTTAFVSSLHSASLRVSKPCREKKRNITKVIKLFLPSAHTEIWGSELIYNCLRWCWLLWLLHQNFPLLCSLSSGEHHVKVALIYSMNNKIT